MCSSPPTTFTHPTWYLDHMVILSFSEAIPFQLSEHNQSPLLPPVWEGFSDFLVHWPLCPSFHCLLLQPSSPSALFHLLFTPPNSSSSCPYATAVLPGIQPVTGFLSPPNFILQISTPTALWPFTAVGPSELIALWSVLSLGPHTCCSQHHLASCQMSQSCPSQEMPDLCTEEVGVMPLSALPCKNIVLYKMCSLYYSTRYDKISTL